MPATKKSVDVNREELIQAINKVEKNGPLPNMQQLYVQVAKEMNNDQITHTVVMLRINKWQIPTQTKFKFRREPREQKDEPKEQDKKPLAEASRRPDEGQTQETRTEYQDGKRIRAVAIPAGKCPVKLGGTEPQEVQDWVVSLINKGRDNAISYTPEALIYFIRHFYQIFSPEWYEVKRHIQDFLEGNKPEPEPEEEQEQTEETVLTQL